MITSMVTKYKIILLTALVIVTLSLGTFLIKHQVAEPQSISSINLSDKVPTKENYEGYAIYPATVDVVAPTNEEPSFSPDGSQLVFTSDYDSNLDLWIINADGSGLRQLTFGDIREEEPDWSPDGLSILFRSNEGESLDIWRIRPDGSDLTQITITPGNEGQPVWSPDGQSVAYSYDKEIWLMDADGKNQRQLFASTTISANDPSFSPTGEQIVFSGSDPSKESAQIFIIEINGIGLQEVTQVGSYDFNPDWGNRGIVFSSDRGEDYQTWIVQPTGENLIRIAGHADPVWSPDGTKIASTYFAEGYAPNIFLTDVVNNTAHYVTKILGFHRDIDIKPGSDPNCFNNNGNGGIPVAILSTETFDATTVDPASVFLDGQAIRVVGKGKIQAHHEDSNGDGLIDLVVQIEDMDGTYTNGTTTATLVGKTTTGIAIQGTDSICVVP